MKSGATAIHVVGIGAGGHARVILDILQADPRVTVIGLTDARAERHGSILMGVPILGGDALLPRLRAEGATHAVICVGAVSVEDNLRRRVLFAQALAAGLAPWTARHERSIVARDVEVGAGAAVMAGAIVNPGATVGTNTIVNTGAIVEHECVVGAHVHLCPGARLAANVRIGDNSLVGIGATIIQGISVGAGALIAAGSVVVRDVPAGARVMGVPGRLVGR